MRAPLSSRQGGQSPQSRFGGQSPGGRVDSPNPAGRYRGSAPSRRQGGLSLFGLLFFGIVLVMVVVVGMRVLPTALEYMAIKRAIEKMATSGETDIPALQRAFDRAAAIDDITTLQGKDLKITRSGQSITISFEYEKRIPLAGPASLVLAYDGTAAAKR